MPGRFARSALATDSVFSMKARPGIAGSRLANSASACESINLSDLGPGRDERRYALHQSLALCTNQQPPQFARKCAEMPAANRARTKDHRRALRIIPIFAGSSDCANL